MFTWPPFYIFENLVRKKETIKTGGKKFIKFDFKIDLKITSFIEFKADVIAFSFCSEKE